MSRLLSKPKRRPRRCKSDGASNVSVYGTARSGRPMGGPALGRWGSTRARLLTIGFLFSISISTECFAAPRRILVALGNNRGLVSERRLRFANGDAQRFASVMKEIGGVRQEDVHLLLGVSPHKLMDELAQLAAVVDRDSTLLFFYSGHGSEEALHLRGERLPYAKLRQALEAVPAKLRLSFIDACRGGEGSKGLRPTEPFVVEPPSQHEGQVVVHAAGPGELTHESESMKAGIFTHYLVSGLRGAADANADGRVGLGEAYQFAYGHTREAMLKRGVVVPGGPELRTLLRGQGPLTLTVLDKARGEVWLPAEKADAYYVVVTKGTGHEVAQVWATPEHPTRLALPAGQFVVHRRAAGEAGRAELALPFGGRRSLATGDFVREREMDTGLKGASEEFLGASPYPHRLGAAVALQADDGESWSGAPALSVSYAYGTSGWMPYATASAWRRQYGDTTAVRARTAVSVSAGARHLWVLDHFTHHAGVALTAVAIRQSTFDGALGDAEGSEYGVAGGLRVDWGAGFPLTSRLATDVGLAGLATVIKPTAESANLPGAASVTSYVPELAVLLSFGLTVGL